mgnify:CR=1 FL=1
MAFGDSGFDQSSGKGKLRIVIDKKTLEIKVEGEGFKGASCEDAMAWVKALGKNKNEELKPEYFDDDDNDAYIGTGF